MDNSIIVSRDDSEDSPITAWRHAPYVLSRSGTRQSVSYMGAITTTSGTAVVINFAAQRSDFQIVDEATLSALEDEIDGQEALEALAEAREKGTISHAKLKAELGL